MNLAESGALIGAVYGRAKLEAAGGENGTWQSALNGVVPDQVNGMVGGPGRHGHERQRRIDAAA